MDPSQHLDGIGFGQSSPMYNFSPQIYGDRPHDGLRMPAEQLDMNNQMYMDSMGPDGLEESLEAKRRRIARACDMCRKKKIKCDGKTPKCTHCTNYNTSCVFTPVEKKRNPPKGAKYIEGVENTVKRMERLLVLSGIIPEDDNGRTDLAVLEQQLREKHAARDSSQVPGSPSSLNSSQIEEPESTPASRSATPEPQGKNGHNRRSIVESERRQPEVEELTETMESLVTNNCGETKYIGSSSGFSIFSPAGLKWVRDKTGSTAFNEMITTTTVDDNRAVYWKQDVFGDIFARPIYQQLPSRDDCMSLLTDFFRNFNCMMPLFHQPTFMVLAERQYSGDPYQSSGWWACLNVVLAIAHRLRVMSGCTSRDEDEKAWAYLKNAFGVFPELTLRNTDLLSVQALLGMALFMLGTPNQQPSTFLVAAAIRGAHSIGLHRRGDSFKLNPIEIRHRNRVFWIAYLLDKDLCLRSGRPMVQGDDDMNVELPETEPEDNIGDVPIKDGKVNLFRIMIDLSVIQSKVYQKIYSTQASKQSNGELLFVIGDLDEELEKWKEAIPVDFRPGKDIQGSHTPLILHVVSLHFAYYNCLATIHRRSAQHTHWSDKLADYAIQGNNSKPYKPRVFQSASLCLQVARSTIALIEYVPPGDNQCVWLVLYHPVSALMTLFSNTILNPSNDRARDDLDLMTKVVNFMAALNSEEENGPIQRILTICTEFQRTATRIVDNSEKDRSAKKKRKNPQHQDPPRQAPNAPATVTPRKPTTINHHPSMTAAVYSPSMGNQINHQMGFSPVNSSGSGFSPVQTGPSHEWYTDIPAEAPYLTSPVTNGMSPYGDVDFPNESSGNSPVVYLPQEFHSDMQLMNDLTWASNLHQAYPHVENGVFDELNFNFGYSNQQFHSQQM